MKTKSLLLGLRHLLIPVILSVGITPLSAKITDTVTRSFSVSASPSLVMMVTSADIAVLSGSSESIDFTITRTSSYSDEEKARQSFEAYPITFQEDGDTVTLTLRESKSFSLFGSKPKTPHSSIAVTVPAKCGLTIEAASGDVEVEGITGDHQINASSGDISMKATRGDLHVHTGSGDIVGSTLEGNLRISAASGDVDLTDVGSLVDAHTASGDIGIKSANGSVEVRAASGDISVSGTRLSIDASAASGDIHLEVSELYERIKATTASGDVRLRLGPNNHATVKMSSSSRRVRSSLSLSDVVQDKKQREMSGTLGSGTHRIEMSSASGSVKLEEL